MKHSYDVFRTYRGQRHHKGTFPGELEAVSHARKLMGRDGETYADAPRTSYDHVARWLDVKDPLYGYLVTVTVG